MTVEQRLADALRELDSFDPSPDLFARVERSVAEDRAFRRRRVMVVLSVVLGLAVLVAWVVGSARRGLAGHLFIDGWRLAVAFVAVAAGLVVALAPHIRRFGKSFVDDVFHLSPKTGGLFLAVLDIAYYALFTGLILVDADVWGLGERLLLYQALDDFAFRLGFVALVMGVLHATNIAFLPVLGLIYNSIVRSDLRRRAGDDAPTESARARAMDRNARRFAIGIAVTALAIAFAFATSVPGVLSGWFE
jgi:hypothetical protein